MSVDIKCALALLDAEVSKKNLKCELVICGGAALILMGIISRETVDIDVVSRKIPDVLLKAASIVAKKMNYPETWLNNQVCSIIERLPADWEANLIILYSGTSLTVKSLSRRELINSKLHAAIEKRTVDYADLIALNPSLPELEAASLYCLKQASNENYEAWINGYVKQLKKDLGLK